jgi:NAD(P)-dependent dehydrogenase (short-subunit alcohol dehydrogenase family)
LKTAISTLQPLDIPSSSIPPSTSPVPDSDSSQSTTQSDAYAHTYIAGDITHFTHFWGSTPAVPFGFAFPPGTKFDVLVNCAGVTQSNLFMKTTDEQFTTILDVNLKALMHGTRFLMRGRYLRGERPEPGSIATKSPVIINIASLLGVSGGYGAVAYAASKAGVLGFTRALATEYASHRVRVNAVVPGYIETDMTAGLDEKALRQRIPLGRFGKVEEVAGAVLFLAENDYAHNCVVNLDGGLSAV